MNVLEKDAQNHWKDHHSAEISHYEYKIQQLASDLEMALSHIKKHLLVKLVSEIGITPWEEQLVKSVD